MLTAFNGAKRDFNIINRAVTMPPSYTRPAFQQIVQISITTLWLLYAIGVQVTSVSCSMSRRHTNYCCPPQWTQSGTRFIVASTNLFHRKQQVVIIWTNKNVNFTPFSKLRKRNVPQMFPLVFDLQPVGVLLCPTDHPDSPNQSPWSLTLKLIDFLTISNIINYFFLLPQ